MTISPGSLVPSDGLVEIRFLKFLLLFLLLAFTFFSSFLILMLIVMGFISLLFFASLSVCGF